jgi:hypothetical protein
MSRQVGYELRSAGAELDDFENRRYTRIYLVGMIVHELEHVRDFVSYRGMGDAFGLFSADSMMEILACEAAIAFLIEVMLQYPEKYGDDALVDIWAQQRYQNASWDKFMEYYLPGPFARAPKKPGGSPIKRGGMTSI